MLQVDEKSNAQTLPGAVRGMFAGLIATLLFGTPVSAGTVAASAATKPAVRAGKHVSPYARAAAAQRVRDAQPANAHAPTMVQGMGKAHKSHVGAPSK